MTWTEESVNSLANKVNELRGFYGFETVKYYTSLSNKDVFLRLPNPESSDCGVTAYMGLKGGCFGIRAVRYSVIGSTCLGDGHRKLICFLKQSNGSRYVKKAAS